MTTATNWLSARDLAFRCNYHDATHEDWKQSLEADAEIAYAAHQTRDLIARLVAANITTEAEARAVFALAEDFRDPGCLAAQKQLQTWIKQL